MVVLWISFEIYCRNRPIERPQQQGTPCVEELEGSFVSSILFPAPNAPAKERRPHPLGVPPNVSFHNYT